MLFLAAMFSGLIQLSVHLAVELYIPRLGKLPRYVLGTLGCLIPATVLAGWQVAQVFWMCAIASGLAVVGANQARDAIRLHQDRLAELERLRMSLHAETEKED